MNYTELVPAAIAALATAVFIHLRQMKLRRSPSLKGHLDIVLMASTAMFLLVMVIQHPEWLTAAEMDINQGSAVTLAIESLQPATFAVDSSNLRLLSRLFVLPAT